MAQKNEVSLILLDELWNKNVSNKYLKSSPFEVTLADCLRSLFLFLTRTKLIELVLSVIKTGGLEFRGSQLAFMQDRNR